MRIEKDKDNVSYTESLLLEEKALKKYKEEYMKKSIRINEQAKKEREEFNSKIPLRFP